MDTSGIRSTYQNIGTYSSLVCPEELREFSIRQTRSDPNGQSNCSDVLEQDGRYPCKGPVRQQDGRYPCKGPVRLSPANMAVESGKEHSNISTRERKCDSRSGITPSQGCQRLETRHTDIQSHSTEMGTIQCRSFAARHNKQIPTYFSWKADPAAAAVNAMVQEWGALTLYAFPPFILIGRVLLKMKQDQVLEACLITPLWRAQPWFPLVLEMSIDFPVLIPLKIRVELLV